MNVISFPLPAEVEMTDAELASHLAAVAGKALARQTHAEIDADIYRAAWLAVCERLEAFQLRRLRFAIAGAAAGAIVAWCLDGKAAEKLAPVWPALHRALDAIGWVVS